MGAPYGNKNAYKGGIQSAVKTFGGGVKKAATFKRPNASRALVMSPNYFRVLNKPVRQMQGVSRSSAQNPKVSANFLRTLNRKR